VAFSEAGRTAGGWAVAIFDQGRDRDFPVPKVEQFLRAYSQMADKRGLRLGSPPRKEEWVNMEAAIRSRKIDETLAEIANKRSATFFLCVIGDNKAKNVSSGIYPAIKRFSATTGYVTQCVQIGKVAYDPRCGSSPPYSAGILLKTNVKLGGKNHKLARDCPVMSDAPTIVFGLDVNHAGAYSRKPSYTAVVATMDKYCASYYTTVGQQESRKEIVGIQHLAETVKAAVLRWKHKNGELPHRLIFFRDGVAHNQFKEVVATELQAIRDGCTSIGDYFIPTITFICCQMRTRCRIALSKDAPGKQNVPPGTVVDTDITEASAYDFYMVPHHSLKGTARPSHYHVLHDEVGFPPDVLQRFTFDLCHLYARATKIVGRPAPVYYAHLAAYQAEYFQSNFKADKGLCDGWETGSVSSATGSDGSSGEFKNVHEEMRHKLYYA